MDKQFEELTAVHGTGCCAVGLGIEVASAVLGYAAETFVEENLALRICD
jgi:hypothetical protein